MFQIDRQMVNMESDRYMHKLHIFSWIITQYNDHKAKLRDVMHTKS